MGGQQEVGVRRGLVTAVVLGVGAVVAGTVVLQLPGNEVEVSSAQVAEAEPHDSDGHRHASTLGSDGRFTGPGEGWPPRPKDATDVADIGFSELAAMSDQWMVSPEVADREVIDGAELADQVVDDSDEIREALGERYNLISVTANEVVPGREKGNDDVAALVVLYSLSTDQTVEAWLADGTVIATRIAEAGQDQPPLSAKEKFRAAELARAHWATEGDDRIEVLEGFTILAVEPDGTYYDSRVAYVSFHTSSTARPELLTWVDLTTESILTAEVDR